MRVDTFIVGLLGLVPGLGSASHCSLNDQSESLSFVSKPRTFILTDILNEPDDSQSLIRYLLYANSFDTRGLVATTSIWLQNNTHPEAITAILDTYATVVDNLNQHVGFEPSYESSETLKLRVTSGPTVYGQAAFQQELSHGAALLISSLQESEEPLFVSLWGGANTLAQALQYASVTYTEDEFSVLRNKLRVYAISDQDDTGEWIRQTYPDIVYIVSSHAWAIYPNAAWQGMGFSGMSGANNSIVSADWLAANIQSTGPLGEIYPDIALSMEGDSPSWMWLIENGLGNRDHIEWGSWGGRYDTATMPHGTTKHYFDTMDRVFDTDGNYAFNNYATIWRWRAAFQEDFAARMQWSNSSDFSQVSHPPFINVNGSEGPETMWIRVPSNISSSNEIILDATKTIDTDNTSSNGDLEFQWYQYWDPTLHIQPYFPTDGGLKITSQDSDSEFTNATSWNDAGFSGIVKGQIISVNATRIDVSAVADGDKSLPQLQHLILQVTNKRGKYPIRRYKRVVFEIGAQL
ncbi:hypothetical protein PFICI_01661 [Pestalotiopsis fici W106-1]|uniref:DUF1593 domain-containing protein n=1 Tax=Pestalotiopsis fici (strain W106-1 / CGMCC3.15140) TaxID=1229662 RepID=W3XP46_PESFW|nr:uncharacterized protein PFICI_01661 [Pestalotiopsis fici W106-1]ETS87833.1 hypothetical protein PFICI_01661 [Pestalotiopsis fici W106-1]